MPFVVLLPNVARRVASDPAETERVKASIKVGPILHYFGHSPDSFLSLKHVADNKVTYKHLSGGVEFTDVIPKNPSGKLLRRVLRDRARDLVRQKSKL